MKEFEDEFERWQEDIHLRARAAYREGEIPNFRLWLKRESARYDDAAHDFNSTDEKRTAAWKKSSTCQWIADAEWNWAI